MKAEILKLQIEESTKKLASEDHRKSKAIKISLANSTFLLSRLILSLRFPNIFHSFCFGNFAPLYAH
jgi:hypothetical protein